MHLSDDGEPFHSLASHAPADHSARPSDKSVTHFVRLFSVILRVLILSSLTIAEPPTPGFVVELADAYFESLDSRPEDLTETRQQFFAMFLFGYTSLMEVEVPKDSFSASMA